MNLEEATTSTDHLADMTTRTRIRRDWRTDRNAAILGDLAGNIADAANVQIAVLL